MNWRFFWDYSGGNVFENMVHQVGYWHTVLGLTIPQAVTMTGGNYLSPQMQPPDVMDVTMRHAEKLLFTWNSMFSNDYYGEGHDLLLGTKGTIVHDPTDKPRYLPQGGKATKLPTRQRIRPVTMRTRPTRTCRTSSIACEAGRNRTARSRLGTAVPSRARWRSAPTARAER